MFWPGTSATRFEWITLFGLFHKRGFWTPLDPKIAHGYTRRRASEYGVGSATVVLLLDRREIKPGIDYNQQGSDIFRFHAGMPPENIEYILWDDRIQFLGM